jgi:hypothetical protein
LFLVAKSGGLYETVVLKKRPHALKHVYHHTREKERERESVSELERERERENERERERERDRQTEYHAPPQKSFVVTLYRIFDRALTFAYLVAR